MFDIGKSIVIVISITSFSKGNSNNIYLPPLLKSSNCQIEKCPTEGQSLVCGFNEKSTSYKMFPSNCALEEYANCYNKFYNTTPLEFCIKEHNKVISPRRSNDESCPVFCPSHYRPVCGASKFKRYNYRAFNNGCYLDMLNCRGEDEDLGYIEVPLEFCQRHLMKNIYKEQIIVGNVHDYRDYE